MWMRLLVVWCVALRALHAGRTHISTTPAPIPPSAGDPEGLRCMLAADTRACPAAAPPAAAALLRAASEDLRSALGTQGLKWAEASTVRGMGPALLALLPERHLRALPAAAGAELLRARPDAAGLAAALTSAFAGDPPRRMEFLERVSGAALGARAEALLGAWAAHSTPNDTAYDELSLLRRAGSGLLASLPAPCLLAMSQERGESYVFTLRAWRDMARAEVSAAWQRAPALSKRAWALLALREKQMPASVPVDPQAPRVWTAQMFASNGFLAEGAVPGEVAALPEGAEGWAALGELSPPPLVARAMLPAPRSTPPPPLNFSLLLAPGALARMAPSRSLRDAWAPALAPGGGAQRAAAEAPLGSARAAALLLALADQDAGAPAPAAAGALAWALPPVQRALLRAPSPAALTRLDSPRFSRAEAERLLTDARAEGQPAWLQARGLLRGLRAGALLRLLPESLPQPLLLHLLSAFPGDAPAPLALALLAHVRRNLGVEPLLKAALSGAGAGPLLGQLSPAELRTVGPALARALPSVAPAALRALPDRVLWAALDAHLGSASAPSAAAWTPLLLGLRCEHLRAAGPAAAPALLDALNAQLRVARRPFPAALRRCAREALVDFVALRASAHGYPASAPPLAALEPRDAEAFGGFVVAGVPPAALEWAPAEAARALLEAVGRLPLEELLEAAGGAERARALAVAAAARLPHDQRQGPLALESLEALGALLWLLPAAQLVRVDPAALRMLLEAQPPARTRAVCADADAQAVWEVLVPRAFGEASSWGAGHLGALGGLLAALSPSTLDAAPSAAWAEAADALAAAWPHHRAVRLPALPRAATLLEACAQGLSAREANSAADAAAQLARRVLSAARAQLRSALPAGLSLAAPNARLRSFGGGSVALKHEPPRVGVLGADEEHEEEEEDEDVEEEEEEEDDEGRYRRRRRGVGDDLRAATRRGSSEGRAGEASTEAPDTNTATHQSTHGPARNVSLEDWCGGVALAGPAAGAALGAQDFAWAAPEQLRACAETLGALRLSAAAAEAFWARAPHGEQPAAGEKAGAWAADAGALLRDAPPERLGALPLRDLDVRAAVAAHLHTEEQALEAGKALRGEGAELSAAALASAGAGLCALTEAEMARAAGPGRALADAAAALGALPWPHCPRRCLAALARLLTKGEVLGAAERWGPAEAAAAGALAAGLPNAWKALTPRAAQGLSPSALRCIPPRDFEELSAAQAQALSPSAAAALSEAQLERVHDTAARAALDAALADAPPAALLDNSDSAAGPVPTLALPLALATALALGALL